MSSLTASATAPNTGSKMSELTTVTPRSNERFANAWNPDSRTGLRANAISPPSGWAATRELSTSWTLAVTRTSMPVRRAAFETCAMCSGRIALDATKMQSASYSAINGCRSSTWPIIGMSVVGRPQASAQTYPSGMKPRPR